MRALYDVNIIYHKIRSQKKRLESIGKIPIDLPVFVVKIFDPVNHWRE